MDKAEIRALIETKKSIYNRISELEKELVNKTTTLKTKTHKAWNMTNWEEVLGVTRPTEKLKKAYVDENVSFYKADVESCKNNIEKQKRDAQIIDDTLKYLGGMDD